MDRRDFFRSMLGASIVATIPAPIFDALIKSPIKEDQVNEFGIYLFKDNDLIIYTKKFDYDWSHDIIDITTKSSSYKDYVPGNYHYNFTLRSTNSSYFNMVHKNMMSGEILYMIFQDKDSRFAGNVIITRLGKYNDGDYDLDIKCIGKIIIT